MSIRQNPGARRDPPMILAWVISTAVWIWGACMAQAEPPFLRGDVDADGQVDEEDAESLLLYLLEGRPEPACLKAADADDSGWLDTSDSLLILGFLTGGGPLAPPFPGCGTDRTPDDLSCQRGGCDPADNRLAAIDDDLTRDFRSLRLVAGVPRSFELARGIDMPCEIFFETHAELFGLGDADVMEVKNAPPSSDPRYRNTRMQQFHEGVRVIGAEFVLVEVDGSVVSGLGRAVPGLNVDTTAVRLDEQQAVELALAEIWRRSEVRPDSGMDLASPPATELVLSSPDSSWEPDSYKLVYRCSIVARLPLGDYEVDVDAGSGEVLRFSDGVRHLWETTECTGTSLYDGSVKFRGESDANSGTYRLRTSFLPFNVATFDNQGTVDTTSENDFTDPDSAFGEASQEAGVSAHWAAQRTLEYLWLEHGRLGIDGLGGLLTNRVHFDTAYDGAHFLQGLLTAVFGDSSVTNPISWASLDIVAHELTHGVTGSTTSSQLLYEGESGALNESFSDIFAILVKFATYGPSADWSIGKDLYPGQPYVLRWVDNPKKAGVSPSQPVQPTTYQGAQWTTITPPCDTSNDHCGVHDNSGVQNRWFYLLSEGGGGHIDEDVNNPQYTVAGIGKTAAAEIAYINLTAKLSSTATFALARDGAVQAAVERFGEFSQQHASVEDAWYAVGVGNPHGGFQHFPLDGELDVPPWDATLTWEMGQGQSAWDLQLSTANDFTSIVHFDTITNTGLVFASTEVTLDPGTLYYWRIREHTEANNKGWRPTKSFTTADQVPTTDGPEGPGYHPWELPFVVTKQVSGATHYQIQVFDTSTSDPIFAEPKTFPVPADLDEELDFAMELTVPKDRELCWTIRALKDTLEGNWSPICKPFVTVDPVVQSVGPASGSMVHPWPVTLEWDDLRGARFDVEVTGQAGGTVFNRLEDDIEDTRFDVNLFGMADGQYTWSVGALGPPWGSTLEPEAESTREEAVRSSSWTLSTDTSGTTPVLVGPASQTCFDWDKPPDLSWNPVPGAAFYRVFIAPNENGCVTGCTDGGFAAEHIEDTPLDQISGPIELQENASAHGWQWNVRAMVSEGNISRRSAVRGYLVRPTVPPVAIGPDNETIAHDAESVLIGAEVVWSNHMKYEIFEGSSCSGTPVQSVVLGGVIANSLHAAVVTGLDPGKTYSWRAGALIDGSQCGNGGALWSTCMTFDIGAEPEPPPPKPLNVPEISCEQEIYFGGNNPQKYIISLGTAQGTFDVHYELYVVPDQIHVFYEGDLLWNSTCTNTALGPTTSPPLSINGTQDFIVVEVVPNCAGTSSTAWAFMVTCPQ